VAEFVIVVDTQVDFMAEDGALSVAGAEALIEPMRAWLRSRDPSSVAGVLFTFDTHDPEIYAGSPEAEAFPVHCVRASGGWANVLDIGDLDPAIPAWTIEKGVFDMWAEADLAIFDARDPQAPAIAREDFFLRLKAAGIETVTVIGVAADYCVRWAIEGLLARGFRVTVPAALTRGIVRQIDEVRAQEFNGALLAIEAAGAS
jgi:nicotinamidase/pyrazinamidase